MSTEYLLAVTAKGNDLCKKHFVVFATEDFFESENFAGIGEIFGSFGAASKKFCCFCNGSNFCDTREKIKLFVCS